MSIKSIPRPSELLVFRGARLRVDRRSLRRFAQRLCEEVAGGRAFCCLVTNDREMRRLNREFLGKDCVTDVLSFPETGSDGSLGEIAISIGRAARQAQEYAHGTEEEICLLMLHGILHLMGLDHENDRGRMKHAEARWRRRLALPAGLISRVPA